MSQEQVWEGNLGNYTYSVYEISQQFRAVAGNYIFCKWEPPGAWRPIYIGETGDLRDRLNDRIHHRQRCINTAGATHIHTHVNQDAQARLDEETDLRRRFDPVCNRQ